MGGATNKLTSKELENAKPESKTRRLSDGGGLYLEIAPNGSKYWRLAYRFAGKQKTLALGVYPQIKAPEACKKAREAKDHLAAGCAPDNFPKNEDEAEAAYLTYRDLDPFPDIDSA